MATLLGGLREVICEWDYRTGTGQGHVRICRSKVDFIELFAPGLEEAASYGKSTTYERKAVKDFKELRSFYTNKKNEISIYNSIKDFLEKCIKYRVKMKDGEWIDVTAEDTLSELKSTMISLLSDAEEVHSDKEKSDELIKTIECLNIVSKENMQDGKALDGWVNTIFYYAYYAITDELHADMPFANYPLKDDLAEYENAVTLKYGVSGKPGMYQLYHLANRTENPNLIALYECGEHEYYGIGPSKKVNYEAAYDYYEKTLECVGNHPLALWSIAYMEFEYLKNPERDEQFRVPKIEAILRENGREKLCRDILEKVGKAYLYAGSSKGAAANLLGKIMEAKEDVFPSQFKIGFFHKSAREYYRESAIEGYVYGCNNYARICMEELEAELKKESKDTKVCLEKANERITYLKKSAMLGEPWAANQYALELVKDKGWEVEGKVIVSRDIQTAYQLFEYGEKMSEMEVYFWPLINICNRFWLFEEESDERRQRLTVSELKECVIPKLESALGLTKDLSQILQLVMIRKKAYFHLFKREKTPREERIKKFLKCEENTFIQGNESEKEIQNCIESVEKKLEETNGSLLDWLHTQQKFPPMVAYCGDKNGFKECLRSGAINRETIYDLASITKFFLAYVYILIDEDKEIQRKLKLDWNLNKTIGDYTKEHFPNISHLRIRDLLSYNVKLETNGRIDDLDETSYDEAHKRLNEIKGKYSEVQVYSDMPMMVLGELLEIITGKSFGEWIDKLFIQKYNLQHTFWNYEKALVKNENSATRLIDNCTDYSNEYRIKASGRVECYHYERGRVHDTKARIISNGGKKLCGNSGLFASAEDICIILKALLNENDKVQRALFRIVLGNGWNKESEKNSFGYGCYRKYYNKKQNEVPKLMSPYTIVATGYTGCYLALDLLNERFVFIGSNRLSGYISRADQGAEYTEKEGYITIGEEKYKSSINYVYQRDLIRDILAVCSFLSMEN